MLTHKNYHDAFAKERVNCYPEVTRFEKLMGFEVDRERLEAAARVLACPVKVNPPNWQHGRVIYAAAMNRLASDREGVFLDIGTAKGFSACVMGWAIGDCEAKDVVVSVDVIDPLAEVPRNSIHDLDGPLSLYKFVDPFRDPKVEMRFFGGGSRAWLEPASKNGERISFAFVDGKHTYEMVSYEIMRIACMQRKGDVIVFDDLQIDPVRRAVETLKGYHKNLIFSGPRTYMHAVKL